MIYDWRFAIGKMRLRREPAVPPSTFRFHH
jgi:hypothetical protein